MSGVGGDEAAAGRRPPAAGSKDGRIHRGRQRCRETGRRARRRGTVGDRRNSLGRVKPSSAGISSRGKFGRLSVTSGGDVIVTPAAGTHTDGQMGFQLVTARPPADGTVALRNRCPSRLSSFDLRRLSDVPV